MGFFEKIMTATRAMDKSMEMATLEDIDEVQEPEEDEPVRKEFMKEIIADSLAKITPKGFFIGIHDDNSAFIYDKQGKQRYYEDYHTKKIIKKEDGETVFQVTDKTYVDLLVDSYGENKSEILLSTPQPVITTHEKHVIVKEKIVEKVKEVEVPVEVEKVVYRNAANQEIPTQQSPQFNAIKDEMCSNSHYTLDISSGELTEEKLYDAIDLLEHKVSKISKSEDNRVFKVPYDYETRVVMANPILYGQPVFVVLKNDMDPDSIERIFKIDQNAADHELQFFRIDRYIESLDEYYVTLRDISFYSLYNGVLYKNNVLEVKGGSSTLNMLF